MTGLEYCGRLLAIIVVLSVLLLTAREHGWIPKPAPGSMRTAKGPLVERVW